MVNKKLIPIQQPTPFGCLIDINNHLNIITHSQSDSIYSSIRKLFEIDIPIPIACDFKVAALLVGIQQASSNYPCPFCLWRNGSLCRGIPDKARKHQDIMAYSSWIGKQTIQ